LKLIVGYLAVDTYEVIKNQLELLQEVGRAFTSHYLKLEDIYIIGLEGELNLSFEIRIEFMDWEAIISRQVIAMHLEFTVFTATIAIMVLMVAVVIMVEVANAMEVIRVVPAMVDWLIVAMMQTRSA
jgi:hypothetical protein